MGRQMISSHFKDTEGEFQPFKVKQLVGQTLSLSIADLTPGYDRVMDDLDLATPSSARYRLTKANCGSTAVSSLATVHWVNLETAEVFDGRVVPFEDVLRVCKHPYPVLDTSEKSAYEIVDEFLSNLAARKKEIGSCGKDGGRPCKVMVESSGE